jgi:glutaredoxin
MFIRYEIHLILILTLLMSCSGITQADSSTEAAKYSNSCTTIEIFSRKGCPHCADAYTYLEKLKTEHPHIVVVARDVYSNSGNRIRFVEFNNRFKINQYGLPSFLICDHHLIGFVDEETSGAIIKQMLGLESKPNINSATNEIDMPLFGKVSVEKVGLPAFTIAIGLVDGFNPCAMWVLLILLSILVNLRDKKRILLIAGTFVFISGAVYFVFMAAWLNLFLIIGFSRTLQIIIGLTALLIGTVHIKDYFAYKKGFSLSIPDSAKPSLYSHIRDVIYAENIIATFVAIIVMAILVNLIELLCTAGLPAIYTQVLTLQQLNTSQYYLYLLLYNIAYMFDDALMVGIVVFTMSKQRLEEEQGRWLKLLSGSIIFILGVLLILRPSLLI